MGVKGGISDIFVVLFVILILGAMIYFVFWLSAHNNELLVASYLDGPVSGATVNAYSLMENGSRGELLASNSTGEDGIAQIELSNPPGRILVESRGGTYMLNGNRVRLSDNFAMASIGNSNRSFLIITPFSNMAVALAQTWARKSGITNASMAANIVVSHQYNVWSVIALAPADVTNSTDVEASAYSSRQYGILMSAFNLLAQKMHVPPENLAQALARDWSDGEADGFADNSPVFLTTDSGASVMISDATGLKEMQDAIDEFIAGPENAANLDEFNIYTNESEAGPDFYMDESSLPEWKDGVYGEYRLSAAGGTPPYSWKVKEGSLPQGFKLGDDGVLYGTGKLNPGTVESISPPFIVEVTDSNWKTSEMEFRITIVEKAPELMVNGALCYVNEKCQELVAEASGGTPPYHFVGYSSDNGSYPLDMMLWQDGTLRGTPKSAGGYAMNVCVIDLIGWESCGDVLISVQDKEQPPEPPNPPVNTCEPGHYSVVCGGRERCCLNGWVCCSGSCAPASMCG